MVKIRPYFYWRLAVQIRAIMAVTFWGPLKLAARQVSSVAVALFIYLPSWLMMVL
jgi:hypothetical protein